MKRRSTGRSGRRYGHRHGLLSGGLPEQALSEQHASTSVTASRRRPHQNPAHIAAATTTNRPRNSRLCAAAIRGILMRFLAAHRDGQALKPSAEYISESATERTVVH